MILILPKVEIPQHPVDLHSIVTVTTKELSSTLQEFRGTILQQRGKAANLPVVPEVPDVPDAAGRSPKVNEERVEVEEKQQGCAKGHNATILIFLSAPANTTPPQIGRA